MSLLAARRVTSVPPMFGGQGSSSFTNPYGFLFRFLNCIHNTCVSFTCCLTSARLTRRRDARARRARDLSCVSWTPNGLHTTTRLGLGFVSRVGWRVAATRPDIYDCYGSAMCQHRSSLFINLNDSSTRPLICLTCCCCARTLHDTFII